MSSSTDPACLFNVEGQVAVVTGGGTGIGLMIAMSLEHNGATVYIVGRRLDVLQKAARENNKYGRMIPLEGDITSRDSLLSVAQTVKSRHGYIDLLVNNAGISRNLLPPHLPSPLDETDFPREETIPSIKAFQDVLWNTGGPVGFAETFETNVTAVYFTTVAFLELLHFGNLRRGALPPKFITKSNKNGESASRRASTSNGTSTPYFSLPPSPSDKSLPLPMDASLASTVEGLPPPTSQVITISSSGSFRVDARVLSISYTLAKHACTHLGKLLANLLADWNIRSNVLCPGVWPSEMTNLEHLTPALLARAVPLGRSGTLAEMAGPILFLAGRAGAYVNGAVWLVDGGRVGQVASSY
ncbi:NAD(P)-binding protein [Boletus reticuloceps]|uniref:NAD(P)-binding protein n=1 Tax=Boletus reticuloceps TaxID=495285 RepID=A0A8I2YUE8_9AGAM|nr:NAD(P)-binding protein [Boletus reticuloceps]